MSSLRLHRVYVVPRDRYPQTFQGVQGWEVEGRGVGDVAVVGYVVLGCEKEAVSNVRVVAYVEMLKEWLVREVVLLCLSQAASCLVRSKIVQ